MKPSCCALLVAQAFIAAPLAFGADGSGLTLSGSASLGYRLTRDTALDPSKLNEYRDLDSGALTVFDVRGRGDSYYLNAFGENLGRDDQYLDFWGGKYGDFKYELYGNWLRHNFGSGFGALSPYSGIGTGTLTAVPPFPRLSTGNWNTFDNGYDRQDVGGMFEISMQSPWYFRTEANEVRRSGIKVIAGAQGTSPGNGFVDLPSPVDFTTQNASFEGGYQTKQQHFSVGWMRSKFSNDNELLRWSNGFFAPAAPTNYDTTVLPPDNEFWRLSLNAVQKQLPLESTLAGRFTYGKLTNEVPVLGTMLSTGTGAAATTGAFPSTAPSSPLFQGEIVNKAAAVSLTSRPQPAIDTRLYWNWSRKDNNSTALKFSPAAGTGLVSGGAGTNCATNAGVAAPCVPELFNYKKNNFGLEGSYRLNTENKLSAGFDYLDTERQRVDFDETKDRKFYIEWKNSSLDLVSGRLKYQYLERRSNYVGSTDPTVIDSFVRRFDYANVDQNLVKLVLDSSPAPLLDLGLEAIYKNNNYKDTILGRTDDRRQELYANVSYGDPKSFRVMLFGDVEFLQYDSLHRVGSGNADPSAPPAPPPPAISTTYTWSAKNRDRSWQVGLGADWLPTDRWKFNGSLIYARTEGTVDFTQQAAAILNPPFLFPIPNFDNTRRVALNMKGAYKLDKNWELTGGYAFERYRYSDIGFDNFTYTVGTGTTASYLTGQSAFQNYTTNIFYALATYRF